jgi:hypothetical protein
MKKIMTATTLAAALLLTGCGSAYTGPATVGNLEYDDPDTVKKRKKVGKAWKTTTKREPAEWELTVTTAEGDELEFEIPKTRYDALKKGARCSSSMENWPADRSLRRGLLPVAPIDHLQFGNVRRRSRPCTLRSRLLRDSARSRCLIIVPQAVAQ